MPAIKVDFNKAPFLDSEEYYNLPVEEQNAIDDAAGYTEEATAVDAGKKIISRFDCMQWDTNKEDYCEGEIELARYNLPPEIRWKCKKCGNNGLITNFKGTPWDLSGMSKQEAQQYLDEKYNLDLFPGLGFKENYDSIASFEESMGDIMEWMENLSEEEFEDFHCTMEAEAEKIGISLDELDRGLLPAQRYQLMFSNWTDPNAPLYLRDDLPLDMLSEVGFFHNARTFLTEIAKNNGFELTKGQGNLQRKYIEVLIDKFIWPDGFLENLKDLNKVINEIDVWPLHTLRVLLDMAGMIRKYKGKFVPVKKNTHLMKEAHAGKLYQKLFSAFFKQMNMAYLTNSDPMPYQQDSIPYILFRMQFMEDEWHSIGNIMENVFLDDARFEFYSTLNPYTTPALQFYYHIMLPLKYWGLIEVRGANKSKYEFDPEEARKTPLFDAFLQFNGMFKL